MRFLTRQEELILLAVFRLKDNAYLVTVREHLIEYTGKEWTVGALYVPLDRLRREGFLDTSIGEATAVRGRNAIKYYHLTKKGSKALADIKKVHDVMWENYDENTVAAKNE
ncbi:PadR family transcriptional regulator [candidate division KSB1 bacterium]